MNRLYYGDNLHVLREQLANDSIDLIYLDPPFNSKRDYNLLFKSPKGLDSQAQITAFEDSWHWGEQAEREFDELMRQPNTDVAELMRALRSFLKENDMMAYITMMANRLLELQRVLKPSGSLYLHCDPTASHYLKILLDGVFGKTNFQGDITWRRTSAHVTSRRWAFVHDVILCYCKNLEKVTFHPTLVAADEKWLEREYRHEDERGRYSLADLTAAGTREGPSGMPWREVDPKGVGSGRHWRYHPDTLDRLDAEGRIYWPKAGRYPKLKQYLADVGGRSIGDVWTDIPPLGRTADERLGYPTQKPLALLERIICASSNERDVVLDPFCGCGTAVHAAQKLNRGWIGIDITHLAISLIEKRLTDAFGEACAFEVIGTPKDLDSAKDLAARDKYQFQWWAVSLVGAQPYQGKKKGADTGIDGLKFFHDIEGGTRKIVVSVKGGKLKADDVRALNHVRERESAEIALLISLQEPTSGMKRDAASAGLYDGGPGGTIKVPRVQMATVKGLLSGAQRLEHPDYEPNLNFKKAKKESKDRSQQLFE